MCLLFAQGHINSRAIGVTERQKELGRGRTCKLSAVLKEASGLSKPKDGAGTI